jgi:hypothetical protein
MNIISKFYNTDGFVKEFLVYIICSPKLSFLSPAAWICNWDMTVPVTATAVIIVCCCENSIMNMLVLYQQRIS